MKVLVVDQSFSDRAGGTTRVAHDQVIALREAGATVVHLSIADKLTVTENDCLLEAYRVGTVGFLKPSRANFREIKRLFKEGWDVVHVHVPLLLGLLAVKQGNRHGAKTIFTIHSSVGDMVKYSQSGWFALIKGKVFGGLLRFLARTIGRLLTTFIALNKAIKAEINELFGINNVTVMRNGCFLSNFQPQSRMQLDTVELVSVGNITALKNHLLVIKSLRFLPKNFHLTIIGEEIDDAYVALLRKEIVDSNVSVTLTGKIDHEKISQYLAQSDIYVTGSVVEGQSIATIEALSVGIPVVALENGSSRELLNSENGCIVEKTANEEQFAQCITTVLEKIRCGEMTKETIRRTIEKFSWESVAADTLKMYETLEYRRAGFIAHFFLNTIIGLVFFIEWFFIAAFSRSANKKYQERKLAAGQ
jgi:glycosyltransferase involved in cell wall biosynthesis